MKNSYIKLILCYVLWGLQPLYWVTLKELDSYTILALRIIFASLFSCILLAKEGRLQTIKAVFMDKNAMKCLVPATLFLLGDWAIYIIAVQNGHVLDVSLGYYINPLILFGAGIIIYKEKCGKPQLLALLVALAGVVLSTISLGSLPLISLAIALDWAVYSIIKKYIKLDSVQSIAVETMILSVPAFIFLLFFRMPELCAQTPKTWFFMICSGIVTALPMYLYSDAVKNLPLIIMCFAHYLSPTFSLFCGLLMHETFSESQLISLAFFIMAIIIFTVSEVIKLRKEAV